MKRVLATAALCLTIGLSTAACGGGSDDNTAATGSSADGQSVGGQADQRRMPGGSGKVAEVSGTTAQVAGQDSQVAVSWTDSTTFTQQVPGKASDVVVGSCVMVTSADGSSTDATKVAAATVRITEAVDGSCSAMGGPGGGSAPSGERPTDLPERPAGGDAPAGAAGGRGPGGFAVGEVTAVSKGGFTVASTAPARDDASDTAAKTTVSVTTSDDTTYSTTAAASAKDIEVGVCVTSIGEAGDTGAITATSIAVSQPTDGECSTGFGGRRPGADS